MVIIPTQGLKTKILIYSNGIGLIEETKKIKAKKGKGKHNLAGFASTMIPASILIENSSAKTEIKSFSSEKENISINYEAQEEEEIEIKFIYLSLGIYWHTNYSAALRDENNNLYFNAWVHLKNDTGKDYENADISLVNSNFSFQEQKKIFLKKESVIYKCGNEITLKDKGQANFEYIKAATLKTHESLRIILPEDNISLWENRESELKAEKWLRIMNKKSNGLGKDLPPGSLSFYNQKGSNKFLAATKMHETKKESAFSLPYSPFEGLKVKIVQSDFVQVTENIVEVEYRIFIENKEKRELSAILILPIPKGQWELLSSSEPIFEVLKSQARWIIFTPAESSKIFKVKYRFKKA